MCLEMRETACPKLSFGGGTLSMFVFRLENGKNPFPGKVGRGQDWNFIVENNTLA